MRGLVSFVFLGLLCSMKCCVCQRCRSCSEKDFNSFSEFRSMRFPDFRTFPSRIQIADFLSREPNVQIRTFSRGRIFDDKPSFLFNYVFGDTEPRVIVKTLHQNEVKNADVNSGRRKCGRDFENSKEEERRKMMNDRVEKPIQTETSLRGVEIIDKKEVVKIPNIIDVIEDCDEADEEEMVELSGDDLEETLEDSEVVKSEEFGNLESDINEEEGIEEFFQRKIVNGKEISIKYSKKMGNDGELVEREIRRIGNSALEFKEKKGRVYVKLVNVEDEDQFFDDWKKYGFQNLEKIDYELD